jgi:hypothetical protein
VGDAHGSPRVRREQRERSGTRANTSNGSSARGQIDPDARSGARNGTRAASTPPAADAANARPGGGAHRKQAGPVRKTIEVVVSGAAGMALVGGLLVLLHAGGMPPAVAAEIPPPRTHAPTGTLTVQPAAPINALGGGNGGSGGNVAGGVQQTAVGAAAQVSTAVPVAPPPSPAAAESGGASQSPNSSPDASASPPHSPSPSPSPSASPAGALGGAVSGVVGGLAGLVGQLVGGLSGGSH